MTKIHIFPAFDGADEGDGGIRRVVEAQNKYLPEFGIEVVSLAEAELVAMHGGSWLDVPPGIPTVSHCHGAYWEEYEWQDWAHNTNKHVIEACRRSDVVTSPSKWVARIFERGMWLRTPVLYHGVDIDEWTRANANEPAHSGIPNEPYVLWNKTRTDPICDPTAVIELARRLPDVRFITTYVPPGAPITSNITVTGRLPYEQAKEYIRRASVYLCNTRETFGIGTLEAMACEVPIAGFNWGGQREIIRHNEHGWLVKPGDYDMLSVGIRYCLDNRERMGAACRKRVEESFTWQTAIKRYALLYEALVERKRVTASKPKVSVIITCYNLAHVVSRAIESVLAQSTAAGGSFTDFEIIVVDDCSPDNTAEVVDGYAKHDARVRHVRTPENLYLAGALNYGIEKSVGQYIVPLDADNELAPGALRVLADALDNGTRITTTGKPEIVAARDIDIAYGRIEFVQATKRFVSEWPTDFVFADQMKHRNQIPSTSMYRRRVWERIGGYRRRYRTAEDADFWTRAVSFGMQPKRVTDAVTLIYWDRPDSMSRTNNEHEKHWTSWYPWTRNPELVPFGAKTERPGNLNIPTCEPSAITVVIPVGPGHARYLPDALDSVYGQTFKRWDVIVVNDSGESLGWVHPFVKVIDTGREGGRGPAVARNLGVAQSMTPYWLPLDADDYLQPDALATMYEAITEADVAYVYSDWRVVEEGRNQETPEFVCGENLRQMHHAVTCLYTRQSWETTGGFDETISAWEDWDFLINLNATGYCGLRVPRPLFNYRIGTGTRREELYAKKEQLKAEIFNKWRDYITGDKKMACGGCGGRRTTTNNGINNGFAASAGEAGTMAMNGVSSNGAVLLEFIGPGGARTFKGANSGTQYRFGSDQGHKFRYVLAGDAEMLLLRPHEFRRVHRPTVGVGGNTNGVAMDEHPVLEAVGPPQR